MISINLPRVLANTISVYVELLSDAPWFRCYKALYFLFCKSNK